MKLRHFTAVLFSIAAVLRAEVVDISDQVERVRDEHDVPALAVAAMDEGKLVAIGAAGLRNVRRKKEVTSDDVWLLSSCTKSMTASVAAMLVEEERIRWDSTLAEIFPDQLEKMDEDWQQVTLEQLLVHRGGAPHDPPADVWKEALERKGKPAEQREAFVQG